MKYINIITITMFMLVAGCQTAPTPHTTAELPRVNEHELGKKYYAEGDYSNSIQAQTQWVTKYPKDAEGYVERGRSYERMEKYDLARGDLVKAVELSPENLRAKIYLSQIFRKQNRNKEALETITHCIAHPNFSQLSVYDKFLAYLSDCDIQMRSGADAKALDAANSALECFDSDPASFSAVGSPYIHRLAYEYRSVIQYKLENFRHAAHDKEMYIDLCLKGKFPVEPKHYSDWALALYLSGDHEKCKSVLPKVPQADREQLGKILGEDFWLKN